MAGRKGNKREAPKQPLAGMRPGGPINPDPGYTAGPETVGPDTGAESAGDLTGTGMGGNIDLPDITGRGTTDDLTRYGGSAQESQTPSTPDDRIQKPRRRK